MQIMLMSFGFLLGLVARAVVWAQPMSAPIVDPPRQQMQTVVPNLLVGPYLVNVTGKTSVSDVFLDVAVTDSARSVPDGTTVTFAAAPMTTGDSIPDGASPIHLTAVTTAGHAKFVPDITAAGDWLITLGVTGAAGDGVTPPQNVGIDPHRPQVSQAYIPSQIAIPIVAVVVLLAFFRLRHVELERWPTGRGWHRVDWSETRRDLSSTVIREVALVAPSGSWRSFPLFVEGEFATAAAWLRCSLRDHGYEDVFAS
jgi:hypothetical protein